MYYFYVWEVYSEEWILKGKGHDFFWVKDISTIGDTIETIAETTACSYGVSREYCVITNLKLIDRD